MAGDALLGGGTTVVGRAQELRRLVDAAERTWSASDSPRASALLVTGEAGIGKTSLAGQIGTSSGARSFWSASRPGDEQTSYRPWVQLVEQVASASGDDRASQLADLALRALTEGSVVRDHDAGDRAIAHESVGRLWRHVAAGQRTMLVLEDLHWADEASIGLLSWLVTSRATPGLVVLGTYRDVELPIGGPVAAELGPLLEVADHVRLLGLGGPDFEELVRSLGGDVTQAEALHRRTGGNPLLCREVIHLRSSEPEAPLPSGAHAVILRRLQALDARTRAVLEAAAVWGRRVDVALLARIATVRRQAAADALEAAALAGLIHLSGGRSADFVHSLMAEVLVQELASERRTRLHRGCVRELERLGDARRSPELAHHALQAAVAGDEDDVDRAVQHLTSAAVQQTELAAYEDAATSWERLLRLVEVERPDPRRQADILLRLADARLASGAVERAREAFQAVATVARATEDADLLAEAALGFGRGLGAIEVTVFDQAQIELLEEALAALGGEETPLRVWLLGRLAVALLLMGQEPRRLALAEEAVDLARRVDDPATLGHALTARCEVRVGPDDTQQRADDSAEAIELALACGDLKLQALARRLRVVALLELGRVSEADLEIATFARLAARLPQPRYQWYVPMWLATRALMRGDIAEAEECYEAAQRDVVRAGSQSGWIHTYTLWWMIQRARGRQVEAGQSMTDLLHRIADSLIVTVDRWLVAAAMSGDAGRAHALLSQWTVDGHAHHVRDGEWLPELVQVAEAAVAVGHRPAAERALAELTPYAGLVCVEGDGAGCTGAVAWYLAMLARFLDRAEEAERWEAAAEEIHQRIGLVGTPPPLIATTTKPALDQATDKATDKAPESTDHAPSDAVEIWKLRYEGDTWALSTGTATARIKESKGMHDLARLLAEPAREVHCLDLMGGADVGGDTGPAIDEQARRAYRDRLLDLESEAEDARALGDVGRAEAAERERDLLLEHLSASLGLGGRTRQGSPAAERARSAVTWRIRSAIKAVERVHPSAGAHLRTAITTGTWCSYQPDPRAATRWDVHT